MKRRLALIGALLTIVLCAGAATSSATAAPPATDASLTVPITGTATNALGQPVDFAGTFTLDRFTVVNGTLRAVGELAGTLTNTVTGVVTNVPARTITLPLANVSATCEILDLTLGPLDLDLLGLVVHLDQVHLTIDAESGPGNLLGNLLCGIAGLLDGGAGANTLATVLNRLLSLL